MRKIKQEELLDKLLLKTFPEPNTGCWLWGGMINSYGYGIMKAASLPQFKTKLTHRISYFLHKGEFNYSLQVLHKCDNPYCINPEHLFLGTQQDNMIDRTIKNRGNRIAVKGVNQPMSKLKESDILQIRSLYGILNQYQLAKKFNVTQSNISNIISRKIWNHI